MSDISNNNNSRNNIALIVDEEDEKLIRRKQSKTSTVCLPANVCFCTDGKRQRCCAGKLHLIGRDDGRDDDGAPPCKRAKVEHRDSCLEGDFVEGVRRYMKEVLRAKLNKKDKATESQPSVIPPTASEEEATTDETKLDSKEAADKRRLDTVESLLFATATNMDEYVNLATLDQRLKKLLYAILTRRLNNKIAENRRESLLS